MAPKKTAKPALPATRYRPGKAPIQAQVPGSDSDSDSDSGSDSSARQEPEQRRRTNQPLTFESEIKITQSVPPQIPSVRPLEDSETHAQADLAQAQKDDDSGSGEDESSSGEEESSSDEEPQILKPVFLSKAQRASMAAGLAPSGPSPAAAIAPVDHSLKSSSEQAATDERRQHTLMLVSETMIRDQKLAVAIETVHRPVSDEDAVTPEQVTAEFESWRIRELQRLQRTMAAVSERQAEMDEIKRRRALPAEQRDREDIAYANKLRQEKQILNAASKQTSSIDETAFKFWHKGAFA